MRINIQSYAGLSKGEQFLQQIKSTVERHLSRFGRRITKVDVLLINDEQSVRNKGCVIEAKLKDYEAVAVRAHAGTWERAVNVGSEKMEAVIDHTLEGSEEDSEAVEHP